MSGRRRAGLLLGLALLSCVPSTEDADPRGAAGFSLLPSPATRGEPFETSDGYRITIDRIVVNALCVAESDVTREEGTFDGSSEQTILDAAYGEPFYTPAVPAGMATVRFAFVQTAVLPTVDRDPIVQAGARPYAYRFREAADVAIDYGTVDPGFHFGPSLLVVFHAEGHGKTIAADLTFESYGGPDISPTPHVDVQANALAVFPLHVTAERLFVAQSSDLPFGAADVDQTPHFADLAAADANGDGQLTGAELTAAGDGPGRSLASILLERIRRVFASD